MIFFINTLIQHGPILLIKNDSKGKTFKLLIKILISNKCGNLEVSIEEKNLEKIYKGDLYTNSRYAHIFYINNVLNLHVRIG